jgi:serine/threonine protein kinase
MAEFAKSLERYDVVDRIAVGGMAEVFLAKAYGAHGFEKTLAIKRILPELARDADFENRFIAEAKVAVKLSHTNIVQVLDFGRIENSLFIAMEYVDGLDLAALLKRHRERGWRVPLPAAFQIAIEIARGLDYAHQHGVVHRDVSPSNILLSRAGEVKIADFGIAIAVRPHRPVGTIGPRQVMGKWRYMSPEQTRGESLDTRSDLFSAAAVMFELFTGEKLFPGDEAEAIIKNIAEMPLPRPSQVRSDLPAHLDDILHGALARRAGDRPARAALMLRALTELSYESSIVATALDVAECVAAVLDPVPPDANGASGSSLDDMIRRQLGSGGTAVTDDKRNTAVATNPNAVESTGLFVHKVGSDGLSRLEIDLATMPAHARSRRTTGSPVGLAEARPVDPDRQTEVGPPLADSRPFALVEDSEALAAGKAPPEPTRPSLPAPGPAPGPPAPTIDRVVPPPALWRWGWWLAGTLLVGLVVLVAQRVTSSSAPAPTATAHVPAVDASPARLSGTLEIDSDPSGARAFVDEILVGTTPLRATVSSGKAVTIRLEAPGHDPYVDDRVLVEAGAIVRVRAALVASRATLKVRSVPSAASVRVAGRVVGKTPLDLRELEARTGVDVELSLPGFVAQSVRVDLRPGEISEVSRELKAAPRFGAISLQIDEGWADIYLAGKKIGRAPVENLRVPVGTHRLRLHNPPSGKESFLTVEVSEHEVRYYRTRL